MFLCTRSPAVVVTVVIVVAIVVARHGEGGISQRSGFVASWIEKACDEDKKRVPQSGCYGCHCPVEGGHASGRESVDVTESIPQGPVTWGRGGGMLLIVCRNEIKRLPWSLEHVRLNEIVLYTKKERCSAKLQLNMEQVDLQRWLGAP